MAYCPEYFTLILNWICAHQSLMMERSWLEYQHMHSFTNFTNQFFWYKTAYNQSYEYSSLTEGSIHKIFLWSRVVVGHDTSRWHTNFGKYCFNLSLKGVWLHNSIGWIICGHWNLRHGYHYFPNKHLGWAGAACRLIGGSRRIFSSQGLNLAVCLWQRVSTENSD